MQLRQKLEPAAMLGLKEMLHELELYSGLSSKITPFRRSRGPYDAQEAPEFFATLYRNLVRLFCLLRLCFSRPGR